MSQASSMSNRLLSLDALRGYTIAVMVIVNDPGSRSHVYPPLLHSEWNGITLTDMVFPFFLFMVGVSITLAYTKRLSAGADKKDLYKKIVFRAAKIMLLGLLGFFLGEGLLTGVLPKISIVFLVCAFLFLNTNWKQQVWIASLILIGYWLAMALVPVPIDDVIRTALPTGQVQHRGGMLDIGDIRQISDGFIAANYEPGVNITAWLDRLLGPGGRGLMKIFPGIVTGMIGMLVGRLILAIDEPYKKVTWVFFVGFSIYLVGAAWGWFMPYNKSLWSSSYVLWTAGVCTMGLATCILVVDILGYTKGTKLGTVYGANAITSYALAGILTLVFYSPGFWGFYLNGLWMDGLTAVGLPPKLASLLYAILYMYIIYIPAYILYRKRIFIRL
jgi:predicted acyltransferase